MKRSEIIRRLREGRLGGANGRSVSGGLLAGLTDESLLHIADWLGVVVEPDGPALPASLAVHATWKGGAPVIEHGLEHSWIDTGKTQTGAVISSTIPGLADALVAAYNACQPPLFTADQLLRCLDPRSKP